MRTAASNTLPFRMIGLTGGIASGKSTVSRMVRGCGLDVIDANDFNALKLIMSMAQLMGAHSVVSGLKPGVVSSIIELGVETRDVDAALDLDDAFDMVTRLRAEGKQSDLAKSGADDA